MSTIQSVTEIDGFAGFLADHAIALTVAYHDGFQKGQASSDRRLRQRIDELSEALASQRIHCAGLCAVNDALVQFLRDFLEGCIDHRDHLEIGYSLRDRAKALLAQYGDEQ